MEQSLEAFNRNADLRAASIGRSSGAVEPLPDRTVTCESHGEYVSTGTRYMGLREVWSKCPDCEESRIAAERQAESKAKAEREQELLRLMIGESAIPPRFVGRSFANFQAKTPNQVKALEISKSYADGFGGHLERGTGLIFSGLPGTGKSHLAAAILQAIMPRHCGLYLTCMQMIRAIRGTWRRDSEKSEREVLSQICDVPLLVIDEVGVQYGTDGEQTLIFEVMDRRYREMLPTILLTNQNTKGFCEFVGERVYDRLRETSQWVTFDWDSYRSQAKKDDSRGA